MMYGHGEVVVVRRTKKLSLLLLNLLSLLIIVLPEESFSLSLPSLSSLSLSSQQQQEQEQEQEEQRKLGEDEEEEENDHRVVVTDLVYENNYTIPYYSIAPDSSLFGGITGLTYDDSRDVYYALSDGTNNANNENKLRVYTLYISSVKSSRTRIKEVVYLNERNNINGALMYYSPSDIKPKGIAYHNHRLYISHEAGTKSGGIWQYYLSGTKIQELPIPSFYDFQSNSNIKGFHGVTVTPDGNQLIVATNNGFVNTDGNHLIRFTKYDIKDHFNIKIDGQYLYETEKTTTETSDALLDIIALDDSGSLLTLESNGLLFYSVRGDATDVSTISSETFSEYDHYPTIISKTLLQTLNEYQNRGGTYHTIAIENNYDYYYGDDYDDSSDSHDDEYYYGVHFVALSNNNYYVQTTNVLWAIAVVDTTIAIVTPNEETEVLIRNNNNNNNKIMSRDPAIWVNPINPDLSFIIGTHLDGGLAVYNLNGNILNEWNDNTYHSVDIIYAFKINNERLIDVAIVTGGDNGNIKVFKITSTLPYLVDITDGIITNTGRITTSPAYDVATYISVYDSNMYAFIVSGNNKINQIQLQSNNNGRIQKSNNMNRVITIRYNNNEKIEGIVVDRETGYLYVSLSNRIVKLDAEPKEEDSNEYHEIVSSSSFIMPLNTHNNRYYDATKQQQPQLKGLTMYYSGYQDGYIIVSVSGDSTFAVFERDDKNEYYGTFTIGETSTTNNYNNGNEMIDRTGKTEGIDVININLGPDFECGAFVVQDNENIYNQNGNFKFVPYNVFADALEYELTIDTQSWGPRRFALATWIDTLSQSVYAELKEENISGRDCKLLLKYLAKASYYLYPPATKLRQIMEPIYEVRGKFGRSLDTDSSYDSSSDYYSSSRRRLDDGDDDRDLRNRHNRHDDYHDRRNNNSKRNLRHNGHRHDNNRHRALREKCRNRDKHKYSSHRKNGNRKGDEELEEFMDKLIEIKNDGRLVDLNIRTYNNWLDLATSIRNNIPPDLYYD